MTAILVYSEQTDTALELVAAARGLAAQLDLTVSAAALGADAPAAAARLAAHGAAPVYACADPALEGLDTAVVAQALAGIVEQAGVSVVLLGSTRRGRELGGRLAQRLGAGCITDATSLASIGTLSLGAGSWFLTSRLSFQAGALTPVVTCQLKLSTARDQGRVILDTVNDLYNFSEMSMTRTITATSSASVACNESAGSLGAAYFDLQVLALKAGTLTDTDLD